MNIVKKTFLISIVLNIIFIKLVSANEHLSVQYYFDERYNYYSDSERVSVRANRLIIYKHSEVFEAAMKRYQQIENKVFYSQCSKSNLSDFIINFEPSFFYNPLMQTMYADLNYYIFDDENGEIDRGKISIKKQMYLLVQHETQLENLYLEFLTKINEKIPKIKPDNDIKGGFCKLL